MLILLFLPCEFDFLPLPFIPFFVLLDDIFSFDFVDVVIEELDFDDVIVVDIIDIVCVSVDADVDVPLLLVLVFFLSILIF